MDSRRAKASTTKDTKETKDDTTDFSVISIIALFGWYDRRLVRRERPSGICRVLVP